MSFRSPENLNPDKGTTGEKREAGGDADVRELFNLACREEGLSDAEMENVRAICDRYDEDNQEVWKGFDPAMLAATLPHANLKERRRVGRILGLSSQNEGESEDKGELSPTLTRVDWSKIESEAQEGEAPTQAQERLREEVLEGFRGAQDKNYTVEDYARLLDLRKKMFTDENGKYDRETADNYLLAIRANRRKADGGDGEASEGASEEETLGAHTDDTGDTAEEATGDAGDASSSPRVESTNETGGENHSKNSENTENTGEKLKRKELRRIGKKVRELIKEEKRRYEGLRPARKLEEEDSHNEYMQYLQEQLKEAKREGKDVLKDIYVATPQAQEILDGERRKRRDKRDRDSHKDNDVEKAGWIKKLYDTAEVTVKERKNLKALGRWVYSDPTEAATDPEMLEIRRERNNQGQQERQGGEGATPEASGGDETQSGERAPNGGGELGQQRSKMRERATEKGRELLMTQQDWWKRHWKAGMVGIGAALALSLFGVSNHVEQKEQEAIVWNAGDLDQVRDQQRDLRKQEAERKKAEETTEATERTTGVPEGAEELVVLDDMDWGKNGSEEQGMGTIRNPWGILVDAFQPVDTGTKPETVEQIVDLEDNGAWQEAIESDEAGYDSAGLYEVVFGEQLPDGMIEQYTDENAQSVDMNTSYTSHSE